MKDSPNLPGIDFRPVKTTDPAGIAKVCGECDHQFGVEQHQLKDYTNPNLAANAHQDIVNKVQVQRNG